MNKIPDAIWNIVKDAEGWCWREKADMILQLCAEPHVKSAVEIGVFGAKSLAPLCLGIIPKGGTVHGFDVYEKHRIPPGHEWWDQIDHQKIMTGAKDLLYRVGKWENIIHKKSSSLAALEFPYQSIDYVHIDGSHRPWDAIEDFVLWNLRLKPGGYMVIDDTLWETLKLPLQLLANSDLKYKSSLPFYQGNGTVGGECQVWQKPFTS